MTKKRNGLKVIVYIVVIFFLLFTALAAFSSLLGEKASSPNQIGQESN